MTEFDAFTDLLHRRHSCRAFRPDPVPRATIEKILTAAGRAPSWSNVQPWQVIVTSGAATDTFREALSAALEGPARPDIAFPTAYSDAHLARRREVGWQLYDAVGVVKGDREGSARQTAQNFTFFGAPNVALIHAPKELGTYGVLDCGAYLMAFTLAAEALGIATVAQAAVAAYSPAIHQHFALPDDRMVVCGIAFGYRDDDHPANSFRSNRAGLDEIVDFRG